MCTELSKTAGEKGRRTKRFPAAAGWGFRRMGLGWVGLNGLGMPFKLGVKGCHTSLKSASGARREALCDASLQGFTSRPGSGCVSAGWPGPLRAGRKT